MSDTNFKLVSIPPFVAKNVSEADFPSTVGSIVMHVLPRGTQISNGNPPSWAVVPQTPEDVFAVCGVLLEQSGALSFFGAGKDKPYKEYPRLFVSAQEAQKLERVAEKWSVSADVPPAQITKLWEQLVSHWHFPLNYRAYRFKVERKRNVQYWWKPAFSLFTAADSACAGVGFVPFVDDEKSIASEFWRIRRRRPVAEDEFGENGAHDIEVPSSIAMMADPDVVCVQPKSLVPTVGAGTRVFTRNLALIKPRGVVRTQWIVQNNIAMGGADRGLNLLVLPLPYSYEKNEFKTRSLKDESLRKKTNVFELRQTWLKDASFGRFKTLAKNLIGHCRETREKPVHAIALPELALDQRRFKEFAKFVKELAPELEYILSGSSENCEKDPKKGNYIWIRKFNAGGDGVHNEQDGFVDISQGKHHRWCLDGAQIKDYKLEHGIDKGLTTLEPYWENFSGRPREINFLSFREDSAFCGVVCEDLARSEPCHELIKAIGPNLLFAVLMDGPQIDQRWGAKYASLFAEDHGCAVMTVSSRALVEKSQLYRSAKDRNYSVVYFRSPAMDEAARFECHDENSGIFLRLIPSPTKMDRSLIDGRSKSVTDWILDPSFENGLVSQ